MAKRTIAGDVRRIKELRRKGVKMSEITGFSMTAYGDGWGQGYGVLTDRDFIVKEVNSLLSKLLEKGSGTIYIKSVTVKTKE